MKKKPEVPEFDPYHYGMHWCGICLGNDGLLRSFNNKKPIMDRGQVLLPAGHQMGHERCIREMYASKEKK